MKMEWLRSDKCQKVAFADLWYLFKPGDEVVDQGGRQAYRVIGVTSPSHQFISPYRTFGAGSNKPETSPVIIFCVYIDFDGKILGPVLRQFAIPRFDGEKAVTSLRVCPMRFAEVRLGEDSSQGSFRGKLISRGRQFINVISSQKHMHYSGLTLDSREQVDGQVVIDFERALETKDRDQKNMTWRPKIGSLLGVDLPHLKARECYEFCCRQEQVFADQWAEVKRTENYCNSLVPEERWREPSLAIEPRAKGAPSLDRGLGEEDYVIMSYRVFGFILRSRKWAKLNLTHLSYIRRPRGDTSAGDQQQDMAFHQLVLEEEHKNMLLSLVAQHYRDKESPTAGNEQVDIVRGKGKGLIILLHGAPGVGKTTTAEGVAELFEKPLFQITCGDLGSTAEHVERALETNFALANRWGCILLLDEADVFLAKRSPQDFIRNGLVSVFLRVLEYYAGILFLTTNRIGDFDEAFSSRIHISLHYPQLTDKATAEIFQLNIRLMRDRFRRKNRRLTIDEDEILAYALDYWKRYETMRWNGRQIRNACQTALALAEFDAGGGNHEEILDPNAEVKLSVTQFRTVAKAYREFMYYLNKLYKTDQDRLAHKRGLRARELHGKEMDTLDGKGPFDEGETHLPSQNLSEQHQSPSRLTSTATVMSPQMGSTGLAAEYPNGLAGNYPSAMLQAQAGYGFLNPTMGPQQQPQQQQQVPLNPHQNAQMLHNINPALYQQFLVPQSQMQPATGFPGAMQGQPGFMGDGTHHKP
ncbi:ATP-binding protein [Aspergillus vadensis CBS 113365]|uniref:P-loop containing nucleoside triphosphate hydrolase protein n=1 Tax=Aspergillus vadensis (strain CBS 113365 / IMI 142717 / IBT 24658) TaxID=1448311 RepID=A0A319AVM2_ASPVC|nr:P-loop containing nucleoside triphosphate hydrolase protein [Aspergillus vadensis CBS 113365]PYH64407.1 P-loop containing nucleoside triphosphate hydrolase protein [Aspergillus vadensis CBS 113365]